MEMYSFLTQDYCSRMSLVPPAHWKEVCELTEEDKEEVLSLLATDRLRGLHLRGMIETYGICHPSQRGRFFGYYEDGVLTNVALLGHFLLIFKEDVGLEPLARQAVRINAAGYLLLGPTRQVEAFWKHLARHGRETRLLSPQLWYVCRQRRMQTAAVELEMATAENLEEIVETQAELVREQSGIDPRERDFEGFENRVRERLERGCTWAKHENGKVIFKAEVVCETAEAVYLESIWTHPAHRGKGLATSCVNELLRLFMAQGKVVAILVEPEEKAARRIYERLGFIIEDDYQARFLKETA